MFESKLGNKSEVCKALSIARSTLDTWIKEDAALKEAIEAQNEANIDFAESKLRELIEGVTVQTFNANGVPNIYTQPPNVTACIFYLKTKGKARGYVERQEISAEVTPTSAVFKVAGQEIPFDKKG